MSKPTVSPFPSTVLGIYGICPTCGTHFFIWNGHRFCPLGGDVIQPKVKTS